MPREGKVLLVGGNALPLTGNRGCLLAKSCLVAVSIRPGGSVNCQRVIHDAFTRLLNANATQRDTFSTQMQPVVALRPLPRSRTPLLPRLQSRAHIWLDFRTIRHR